MKKTSSKRRENDRQEGGTEGINGKSLPDLRRGPHGNAHGKLHPVLVGHTDSGHVLRGITHDRNEDHADEDLIEGGREGGKVML